MLECSALMKTGGAQRGRVSSKAARKQGVRWRRIAGFIGLGALGIVLTATLTLVGLFGYYGRELPETRSLLTAWRPQQTTRVLARDGHTVLAELYTERRTVVPLERVSPRLIDALLAAEDADFRAHPGIDIPGLVRALVVNLRRGTVAQGASTITQQVVKNLFLTPERTLGRKVREVLLAWRIERELTKDQILYLYVNQIALGHGRNGVEEAARFYFGRSAREVTLGEAAMLAALPKSPSQYSPRTHPEAAERRRRWVIEQMVTHQFITRAEADEALRETVRPIDALEDRADFAPEIAGLVRTELTRLSRSPGQEALGEALSRGGWTIVTTIDHRLQAAAREAVQRGLVAIDTRQGYRRALSLGRNGQAVTRSTVRAEDPPGDGRFHPGRVYLATIEGFDATPRREALRVRLGQWVMRVPWAREERYTRGLTEGDRPPVGAVVRVTPDRAVTPENPGNFHLELGPQAALVSLDPFDREVRAVVGGYDGVVGMFDRAVSARRQPGSAFKPFTWSFALASRAYDLASTIDPNPGCYDDGARRWCPSEPHARRGVIEPAMSLREALAESRNNVAVRLMASVGPHPVIEHAHALGIVSPLREGLSLALGASEVSLWELTNAYATWAAHGVWREAVVVREVRDPRGRVMWRLAARGQRTSRQVLGEAEAWLMTSALTSVTQRGTAMALRNFTLPVAGKTGTSNRARDAWFVGWTSDLVTGVWVGFDDRQPLGRGSEQGASAALPIWRSYTTAYVRELRPPRLEFARPAGVIAVQIDPSTGLLPAATPPGVPPGRTVEEYFLAGREPHESASPDGGVFLSPDANVQPDVQFVGDASVTVSPVERRESADAGVLVLPIETTETTETAGPAEGDDSDEDEDAGTPNEINVPTVP